MTDNAATPNTVRKKCFVVMGFGEKTDYATGRTLDLDKTYRLIIKKAVEEAGLECIRADDIIHASVIDKPMYEWLFAADLVVADLSTSNANAIYELGVRHALKPRTTIIMAESQFKFPFDLGHIVIQKYEHLGKGIDGEEADRAKNTLKNAIDTLVGNLKETDSPVYTFLPKLAEPGMAAAGDSEQAVEPVSLTTDDSGFSLLLKLYNQAKQDSKWILAIEYLNELLKKRPKDIYLTQQLALATYKSKQPTVEEALANAKKILDTLNPAQTTDPETLGLLGAISKRFWEVKTGKQNANINDAIPDLQKAIWGYEKGFYLKNDFYNGINLAFLLNVRASLSDKRDAIADIVTAERVRKRVVTICEDILNQHENAGNKSVLLEDEEQKFWLEATLVEAYFGTGEKDKAEALKNEMIKGKPGKWVPAQWMIDTLNEQLNKLAGLLKNAPTVD